MSTNLVCLVGNSGKDIELRQTNEGNSVANMRIATDEYVKKGSEVVKITDWHSVVVFGKLAELCAANIRKGDKVYISGRIKNRKWTDDSGVTKTVTEIIANTVEFMTKRSADAAVQGSQVEE